MPEPYRFLSLGAGLDSFTLYMLSNDGVLPRLDGAIFADTMAEPLYVYEMLEWLRQHGSIPIYRVSAGDYRAYLRGMASGDLTPSQAQIYPPFHIKTATGERGAPLHRRCTEHYKIRPIKRQLRVLVGTPIKPVEQWIGFTLDDLGRTFCSGVQWITNVFPMILPLRMRRRDCVTWLTARGYPIPKKSSCTFCPYHSNAYWREMRDTRPDEWAHTVAFEAQLHLGQLPGVRGTPYLHRSLVPLPLAPIDEPETGQADLFTCMHCHT